MQWLLSLPVAWRSSGSYCMQALHGWLLLLCIYFADKSKLGLWFKWLLQVVLSTTRQFFVFCTALGTAQSCLWLGLLCVLVLRLSDVRSNAYLEFKLIVLPYYTYHSFPKHAHKQSMYLTDPRLRIVLHSCKLWSVWCFFFFLFRSGFFWLSLLLKPFLSKCLESAMW